MGSSIRRLVVKEKKLPFAKQNNFFYVVNANPPKTVREEMGSPISTFDIYLMKIVKNITAKI